LRTILGAPTQQQQQQQQVHEGVLRTLLRHFWTGGGNQLAQRTLAPKQQTVTAAVHEWLSSSHYTDHGSSSSSSSVSRMGGAGLAESLAAAGVQMDQLGSERDTALVMQMVERAVGEVPPGKVRRPRIFVYDMPSR
jgi:hypothetical protein